MECLVEISFESSLLDSATPFGGMEEEEAICRWRTSVSLGIAAKNSVKSKLLCGN